MKQSNYRIGTFLCKIASDDESEECIPEDERVFIHNGKINEDGYGVLIGWNEGRIASSTGWGNFMWGGNVRLATSDEIEKFMSALMQQEVIKKY